VKARNLLMGLLVLASFSAQANPLSAAIIEMKMDEQARPGDEYLTTRGGVVLLSEKNEVLVDGMMDVALEVPKAEKGSPVSRIDARRIDCADLLIITAADLLKLKSETPTITLIKVKDSDSMSKCMSVEVDGVSVALKSVKNTSSMNGIDAYALDLK